MISAPVISGTILSAPVISGGMVSVPVAISLACILVCPLNIFANSIGYIVFRIKNVRNHNPANISAKRNTFTPAFLCGIFTCGIACTGTCVVVVGNVNDGGGIGVGEAVGIGELSVIGAGVTLVNIASRSNVFGVSITGCCLAVFASLANPPALPCHSNASIISISSCKEADAGIVSSGDGEIVSEDAEIVSITVDGVGISSLTGCSFVVASACMIGAVTSGCIVASCTIGSMFAGVVAGISGSVVSIGSGVITGVGIFSIGC